MILQYKHKETGDIYWRVDLEEAYDDMLDDVYGLVDVAGYKMYTSIVFKHADPIAYREAFLEFLNDYEEVEDDE